MSSQRKFSVRPDVYGPSDDSFLLQKHVSRLSRGRVLDVGTGCGIQAIAAAKKADSVLAIDINESALRCAKENAERNGSAGKIAFLQSDLFSEIPPSEKFDLIIFNPPYLPTKKSEKTSGVLDAAWNGGKDGRKVIGRFLRQFPPHLAKGGSLLMLHCDLADTEKTVQILLNKGFKVEIADELSVPGEKLSVLHAKLQNNTG